MRTLTVPVLGVDVSRAGLGTAAFGRRLSRAERRKVLEAAFEGGISWFDTAPLYGHGGAERSVGEFAVAHRDRIVVATKVGMTSRRGLRPGVRRSFGALDVRRSLEHSRRSLRADCLDVVLLHDPAPEDITDELLEVLRTAIQDGGIRLAGVAGSQEAVSAFESLWRDAPHVVQVAVPEVGRVRRRPGRLVVGHSPFASAPSLPPREQLRHAVAANPDGVTVFGTTDVSHLRANLESLS